MLNNALRVPKLLTAVHATGTHICAGKMQDARDATSLCMRIVTLPGSYMTDLKRECSRSVSTHAASTHV